MPKRSYVLLFILGLLVASGAAYLQTNPGYMDAYYYFNGGKQIAFGSGWSEMFLWNYLDDPAGLPHPGFTYWMPLTSLVAAGGIKLFPGAPSAFEAAQVLFILVSALVAPVTAELAYQFSGRKGFGWLAGVLVIFSGFYFPFMTTTDSFSIYMLLGGVFFLVYTRVHRARIEILGYLAGLMHLARADGLLWLGIAGLGVLIDLTRHNEDSLSVRGLLRNGFSKRFLFAGVRIVVAYLVVMFPWYVRNLEVFGSLFPPGGGRTLWVLSYDELFSYPAGQLSPGRWWAAGLGNLLLARGEAFLVNLQTTFASMGVLLPGVLAVLGFWNLRKHRTVRLGLIGLGVLFVFMTVVFPFSGMRGSYFHSGAAFVPLIMAAAPVGIDVLTKASLRRFKTWKDRRIRPFYLGVVVLFVIGFSVVLYFSAVVGLEGDPVMVWNQAEVRYQAVDEVLDRLGAEPTDLVVASNPPGFFIVTGRPAIAIPDGTLEVLLAVSGDYGAEWVLVEPNHPDGLMDFYESPQDAGQLVWMETVAEVHIFRWEGE